MNDTQKLRRFKDAVFTSAESKVNEILKQAKAEKKIKLVKAKSNVDSYKSAEFLRVDKLEEQRFSKESSAVRLDAQRKILLHREELVDTVFENIKAKLKQYHDSNDYGASLVKVALEAKKRYPDEKGKVIMSFNDKQYADVISQNTGYEVEFANDILLGGITVFYEDINVILDSTYDSAIKDERQNFCRTANLAVVQD